MKTYFFARWMMAFGFAALLALFLMPAVYWLLDPAELNSPEAFAEFFKKIIYPVLAGAGLLVPAASLWINMRRYRKNAALTTRLPSTILLPAGDGQPGLAELGRQLAAAGFEEVAPGEHYRNGNVFSGLSVRLEEYSLGQTPFVRLAVDARSFLPHHSPFTQAAQDGLGKLTRVLAGSAAEQ